jgi:Arc/MetJ-type ribon-helix-helix transcriptional regulator
MTIEQKPEQEHRIAEALRSGAYQSPDDVIDRALEVLHERDKWVNGQSPDGGRQDPQGDRRTEPGRGHS